MVGMWISFEQMQQRSRHGLGLLLLLMVFTFMPSLGRACSFTSPTGDNDAGMMIHITGHTIQGNYLIITYDIDYPGMTKVKLFNGNRELLWRSQYVDDKEGEHRLVLKASVLNPGNYIFEFDYKNQKQSYPIQM